MNYILINRLSVIYFSETQRATSYDNLFTLHSDLRELFLTDYKKLATIGLANGNIIIVDVENVESYSANSKTLTITFTDDSSINCKMYSSTDATNNLQYLDFVFKNYSPEDRAFAGKTEITVGSSGYLTIQGAINAATSSNYVKVLAGDYSEQLTLKNSVDLWFEEGATLTNNVVSSPMISDNDLNVTVNIYGDGVFNNNGGYTLDMIADSSNINFSFLQINHSDTAGNSVISCDTSGVTAGQSLRLKGNSIDTSYEPVATDGSINIVDIDVLTILAGYVVAGAQKASIQHRYFRSGYYHSEDMIVYSDSTSGPIRQYDFVVNCTSHTEVSHFIQSESLNTFQSWNSIFKIADVNGSVFNIFSGTYDRKDAHVLHGINISNVEYTIGNAAFYTGELTVQNLDDIELCRGQLYYRWKDNIVNLYLSGIPFADQYEIYNQNTLLNTLPKETLSYNYTIQPGRLGTDDSFRFRFRGKSGSEYSDYSSSVIIPFLVGSKSI